METRTPVESGYYLNRHGRKIEYEFYRPLQEIVADIIRFATPESNKSIRVRKLDTFEDIEVLVTT